jgi:hypothetical protein
VGVEQHQRLLSRQYYQTLQQFASIIATLPLWAILLCGDTLPIYAATQLGLIVGGVFVFTASWAALDGWAIPCHIVSKKIEGPAWLLGCFFVLNEFPLIPVDVRFELSGRRQFMYPGFRAPKSSGRSLGIQNLHR